MRFPFRFGALRRRKVGAELAALGDLAEQPGSPELALGFYRQALNSAPNDAELWKKYAQALLALRRFDRAAAAYQFALDICPSDSRLYIGLARAALENGTLVQAKTACAAALAIAPETAAVYPEIKKLECTPADIEEARRQLDHARQGRRTRTRIQRADRARDAGHWELAGHYYREALNRNPSRGAIWVQYGHVLKEAGKLPEAAAAYQRAVACDPNNPDAYEHLGQLFERQGRDDLARAASLRAREANVSPQSKAPEQTSEGDASATGSFLVSIDKPREIGLGELVPLRDKLIIEGWALSSNGLKSIELLSDGYLIANAQIGLSRWDVAREHPDWNDADRSGFVLIVNSRLLPKGKHECALIASDDLGSSHIVTFVVDVLAETYWDIRRRASVADANYLTRLLGKRELQFLIVLRDTPTINQQKLLSTMNSLRLQRGISWTLCLIVGKSEVTESATHTELQNKFDFLDIPYLSVTSLSSIEHLTHAPLKTYVLVLEPGDELDAQALLEFAVTAATNDYPDFLYSDEISTDPNTGVLQPFFKPQWSPDLLLATDYIGRARAFNYALIQQIKEKNAIGGLDMMSSYKLTLLLTELSRTIQHVPGLLFKSEPTPNNDPGACAAVKEALERRGIAANVTSVAHGICQVRRQIIGNPKVSIIIPTRASRGLIKGCIETIRKVTAYPNYEILAIDNIPDDQSGWKDWLVGAADSTIAINEKFNWSRFNNLAVKQATGEMLLFLNDDIEIIDPEWLAVLVENAQRPEVGVVGPVLLWPDRSLQSAGVFLTAEVGRLRHAFRNGATDDLGYFGLAASQRNVTAINGACFLTRRDIFNTLKGFDEEHRVINNETDFCLRVRDSGLLCVLTPHARIVHYERASRQGEGEEYKENAFKQRWGNIFSLGDPYHNRWLSKEEDAFSPDPEPVRTLHPGRPTLDKALVRRILIVKLDHIGDTILSFPAVRALKSAFEDAEISVLCASYAKPMWRLNEDVTNIIEFNFFESRSDGGAVALGEDDLIALSRRLAPHEFDIAVDLRTQPETREILRLTGARYLAGYDLRHQFPWLDVALEWPGDSAREPKRNHASDAMIDLASTVISAAEPERMVCLIANTESAKLPLPVRVQKEIFGRNVVAAHVGAGGALKMWPATSYIELFNLLIKRHNVNIVLVGGPDDRKTSDEVAAGVENEAALFNLAGALDLGSLPVLLRRVALFVGNDSGPKHIAAALGVPTIGIQAAHVDPREWGAVGPMALTVYRDVHCSPCYIPAASACPREMACLRGIRVEHVYEECRRLIVSRGNTRANS